MLANKIGGCATLTLANLGTIAAMIATPLVAGSVNALAVVTTLLGLAMLLVAVPELGGAVTRSLDAALTLLTNVYIR